MNESSSSQGTERPTLPRTILDWLRVFGPGAIIASLTIGTGELIFSSRGGAIFGYRILFVFAAISLLKWALVVSASRHMVLTGVHPYQRMLDFPGPRGWALIMLLLMAAICLPIWVSFHSGVLGNMMSWLTGTRDTLNGGMDYVWGGMFLTAVLFLASTGGYSVLERVQMFIIGAMMICAVVTLIIYNPDWLQLLFGMVPQPLAYPDWLHERYPEITRRSVWVECTLYVGVIGGAAFDYLAYTSWLRDKKWGVLPERATPEQLEQLAANPHHPLRRWTRAPLIDCAISFTLVVGFSAVFVASGALILSPNHLVPNEENFLNEQSRLFTRIHDWLLPLYVAGAFFTMLGTLYGTVETACAIADEIIRSFVSEWTAARRWKLKRAVVAWCGAIAFLVLTWLCIRQASPVPQPLLSNSTQAARDVSDSESSTTPPLDEQRQRPKKLLITILTPINLFTGVLSCGLLCFVSIWMDRRYLPASLRSPAWLVGMNVVGGLIFLALGIKGYWDNENRAIAIGGMTLIVLIALILAIFLRRLLASPAPTSR